MSQARIAGVQAGLCKQAASHGWVARQACFAGMQGGTGGCPNERNCVVRAAGRVKTSLENMRGAGGHSV